MAHEIMASDGLVLAGKSAWHGLGIVVDQAPSIPGALQLAGMDWRVDQCPLTTIHENRDGAARIGIDSHVANVRSDTREVLGVVGSGYVPLQNAELGEFAGALMGQGAKVESAGSIRGGKRVWFLVQVLPAIELGKSGEDRVMPYVLLANGHDGSLAFWVQPTTVRVVCSNTFHAALSDRREARKANRALRIRHTSNVMDRVAQARTVLETCGIVVKAWADDARRLGEKHLTRAELKDYFAGVYGASFSEPDTDRGRARRENVLREALTGPAARFDLSRAATLHASAPQSPRPKGASSRTPDTCPPSPLGGGLPHRPPTRAAGDYATQRRSTVKVRWVLARALV